MGNVFEMEECRFGDVVDVVLKGEGFTPRLQIFVDAGIEEPSMQTEKFWQDLMRDFWSMMRISDLSQLSLRKLACIHAFISVL